MVNYAYCCIGVLWVSLAACLGQSLEDTLKNQFEDTPSECKEALVTCSLPVVLPYATISDPDEFLETARRIRLGEHCRKSRKSFTCFRGIIGENQCSEMDAQMVTIWKLVAEPILDDVWQYICRTEFKKFNIHYSCLLTEEVFQDLDRTCSSVTSGSEAVDCLGWVVKEQCGSTASEITKTLFESVVKRIEDIRDIELGRGEENGADEDDNDDDNDDNDEDEQQQQSTLPESVYARSLAALKKLLKRK